MKKAKKSVLLLILVMVMLMSVCVYAKENTETVQADGYGTLTGTVSSYGWYETTVSYNNDNAVIGAKGVIKDKNGNDVSYTAEFFSEKGETRYSWSWQFLPDGSYSLYGTHEVRNGSKYGAKAVYTYTRI
ncbi:hypothetical protein [Vallitalea guaymasensis]|uniref:hypothetical protein n=1 Tax=Vallitalea guaymasensis TaxID=1185412 RepID=UPI00235538F2|nr:hypothetical protein [Vallitalea guaymasensis]